MNDPAPRPRPLDAPGASPIAGSAEPPVIVVTGGSGFIGRRLVAALAERGWEVRAPSRATGARWPLPRSGRPDQWLPIVAGARAVVHLAAIAHLPRFAAGDADSATRRESRRELRSINVDLTEALALAAARAGVQTFVFISSIKAAGDASPPGVALDEGWRPAPTDCYGVAKLAAERRLIRLAPSTPMDIVILRPPLVFGPGVKANFARLVALARWSARGLPLPFGSIRNRRSLLFVDNLVAAIGRILEAATDADTRPRAARLYHLADEPPLATPQLIERIARAGGARATLVPFPTSALAAIGRLAGREAEVSRLTDSLAVDGARFRRDFDWQPPWTLDQGLAMTVRSAAGPGPDGGVGGRPEAGLEGRRGDGGNGSGDVGRDAGRPRGDVGVGRGQTGTPAPMPFRPAPSRPPVPPEPGADRESPR